MKFRISTSRRLGRSQKQVGAYTGGMGVFKDSQGKFRWVAISSNSYIDRHHEIVSQKALTESVDRGELGDLRFWHEDGLVIGDCDFRMMVGRMLLETGTFRDPEVAMSFARSNKSFQVSIGFFYPEGSLVGGVYDDCYVFERSVIIEGEVANLRTQFWSF